MIPVYESSRSFSGARLFVGGLDYSVTKNDIRRVFSVAGHVTNIYLALDRERGAGLNRGFAFVQMSTPDEALQAIKLLDGVPTDLAQTRNVNIGVKIANAD